MAIGVILVIVLVIALFGAMSLLGLRSEH